MNQTMQRNIKRVSLLTITSFFLSFIFSLLAKEGDYPNGIITKVKNRAVGKTIVLEESKSIDLANITKIVAKVGSTDVFVETTNDKMASISLRGKATGYKLNSKGVLKVEKKDNEIVFSIDHDALEKNSYFGFTSNDINIDVKIPNNYKKMNFEMLTGSGDLKISETSLENLVTRAGSGDIKIVKSMIGKLDSAAGSGDVNIEKSTIGDVNTRSGSGDLNIASSKIQSIDSSMSSGDASIANVDSKINLNTSSGDINVVSTGKLPNVAVRTSSGDVSIVLNKSSNFKVALTTNSGNISYFTSNKMNNVVQSKKSLSAVVGDSKNTGNVTIGTSSGDIFLL